MYLENRTKIANFHTPRVIPECDGHPASHPASHVAVAITLNAQASSLKTRSSEDNCSPGDFSTSCLIDSVTDFVQGWKENQLENVDRLMKDNMDYEPETCSLHLF